MNIWFIGYCGAQSPPPLNIYMKRLGEQRVLGFTLLPLACTESMGATQDFVSPLPLSRPALY